MPHESRTNDDNDSGSSAMAIAGSKSVLAIQTLGKDTAFDIPSRGSLVRNGAGL